MFTKCTDLETVLDTLDQVELIQREIHEYLLNGEALPRPLLATLQDIENVLWAVRHELN